MKRTLLFFVTFLILMSNQVSYPRVGCLAKSQDLKEPFDTKSFHLVACTCDCAYHAAKGKYCPARNQCLECYHSHDPQPMFLVTKIVKIAMEYPRYTIEDGPHALQRLINRYRRQNQPPIFDK